MGEHIDRRPLKVRGTKWAQNSAKSLADLGITPNHISILSVVFAALASFAFYYTSHYKILLLVAPICIQLRLICNLLDGLVAVEHNKSSPNGELYNDVPDRFADVFIIVGFAFAIRNPEIFPVRPIDLAWTGAVVAVITAYVRVLGRSLGTAAYFFGPMAKQHRMFLITITSVLEYFILNTVYSGMIIYTVLVLLIVGGLITVFRRLRRISGHLMGEKNV